MKNNLMEHLKNRFGTDVSVQCNPQNELIFETTADSLIRTMRTLRDDSHLAFDQLMDLCGVDYGAYGRSEWDTTQTTHTGFSRATKPLDKSEEISDRYWVVYHLLSIQKNHRLRVKCPAEGEHPTLPSVIEIWNSANWYEREAFDLFGIHFQGHPDLRRILTDYGFVGHPLRKDFPLSGHVEMRYCTDRNEVIYEPVSIEPRTLVPKVIRESYD